MQEHGPRMYLQRAVLENETYLAGMGVNELAHQLCGLHAEIALQIREPKESDGRIGRTKADFG